MKCVNIKVNIKYILGFLKKFNIVVFLDEEIQRLNLLERKIRRLRFVSSDAEEISEDFDVSYFNNIFQ